MPTFAFDAHSFATTAPRGGGSSPSRTFPCRSAAGPRADQKNANAQSARLRIIWASRTKLMRCAMNHARPPRVSPLLRFSICTKHPPARSGFSQCAPQARRQLALTSAVRFSGSVYVRVCVVTCSNTFRAGAMADVACCSLKHKTHSVPWRNENEKPKKGHLVGTATGQLGCR